MTHTGRNLVLATVGAAALGAAAGAGALAYAVTRRADTTPPVATGADELLGDIRYPYRTLEVVTTDGAHLHVREYGEPDAPTIVFCHGWSCSADYWTPQINALAENYRVVVYDQRGHGRSEVGRYEFSADLLGDDLSAVLAAALGPDRRDPVDRAVIVGHSMGGMSIMSWAGDHADEVTRYARALVLVDTAAGDLVESVTVLPLPKKVHIPTGVARTILGADVTIPPTVLSRSAMQYVALGRHASAAQVAFCERIVRECSPRARARWGLAFPDLDLSEAVENIEIPTTVIVGAADRLTPRTQARKLVAALERAGVLDRFVEYPGVGHMANVEAIDEFNAELVRIAG